MQQKKMLCFHLVKITYKVNFLTYFVNLQAFEKIFVQTFLWPFSQILSRFANITDRFFSGFLGVRSSVTCFIMSFPKRNAELRFL